MTETTSQVSFDLDQTKHVTNGGRILRKASAQKIPNWAQMTIENGCLGKIWAGEEIISEG